VVAQPYVRNGSYPTGWFEGPLLRGEYRQWVDSGLTYVNKSINE